MDAGIRLDQKDIVVKLKLINPTIKTSLEEKKNAT